MKLGPCLALLLSLVAAVPAPAAPQRPADDDQVLERLPVSAAERQLLSKLRSAVDTTPGFLEPALALARRYIQLGRVESDPRHFAHAEAILKPWVRPEQLSPEAMVLRATILQNRHDFKQAVDALHVALQHNPRLPQAWLTLAAVQEAQGNYPAALHSCLALSRQASALIAAVCVNSALSLSGQAESAYRRLSALVQRARGDQEESLWLKGILAELAERLGLSGQAQDWYESALNGGRSTAYLKAAYADFLLAQNRPADVLTLLNGQTRADPLLLRLTLAEQQSGDAGFGAHAETLRARFAAARARGDSTHQGDEARFALHVEHQPQRALVLAESNWNAQREPRDAMILLEAALAAHRPEAARPVLDFIRKTSLEDMRLQKLIKKIEANSL